MIQLSEDCLMLCTKAGESIPYSAQMISVEILGKSDSPLDAEFVKHAASAVLHYFRDELGKESVTVAEFSQALEKILQGFNQNAQNAKNAQAEESPSIIVNSDLLQLADEFGGAGELLFFPRLREELKIRLREKPTLLYFEGLRACAKRLSGSKRWTHHCQVMQDSIVSYLRSCMSQDAKCSPCALVVR